MTDEAIRIGAVEERLDALERPVLGLALPLDPIGLLTEIAKGANLGLEIVKLMLESATPEQRQQIITWYMEDVARWRAFWDKALRLNALDPPK